MKMMSDMEKQRLELPLQGNSDPSRTEGVHLSPAGDFMEDFANYCHAECNERSLPWMLRSFAALRMTKRKELERQVEKRNLTYGRSFASLRMTTKQDVGRNACQLGTPPFTLFPLSMAKAEDGNDRSVPNGVEASRIQKRNPAYERIITSRCGMVLDRSLRKDGKNDMIAGRHRGLPLRMMVVVCLMLLFLAVSPVGAQVPTTRLFFDPTPLQIDTTISPSGVVTLEVADGVDIFAFDLFVHYDPALLRVSQVVVGDFLGDGLNCMNQINDPGLVHYACTRFGVDTGVSGSGVLLELTFEALGQGGDTLLSLENCELYNWPDALPVVLNLEDGAVSVRPYRTYLPLILTASGQATEVLP